MARKSRQPMQQTEAIRTPPATAESVKKPLPIRYKTAIYTRLSVYDLGRDNSDTMENQIELLQYFVSQQADYIYDAVLRKRYKAYGLFCPSCTLKMKQTVLQNRPLQGAERAIAVTGTQLPQRKHSGLKGTRPVPEPRSAEGTMILPLI